MLLGRIYDADNYFIIANLSIKNKIVSVYNQWIHQRCSQSKKIWHKFWWQHPLILYEITPVLLRPSTHVNYGLSIITSNVRQIISVIKYKHWCFQVNYTSKLVFILAFKFTFRLETFISDLVFQITEKKQQNKSKQLFNLIIDRLEGLG